MAHQLRFTPVSSFDSNEEMEESEKIMILKTKLDTTVSCYNYSYYIRTLKLPPDFVKKIL